MRLFDPQRIEQPDPVLRHIGQRIADAEREAETCLEHRPHQIGSRSLLHTLRHADISIVIADYAKTLADEAMYKLVRPGNHLRAQPHDQQDCRRVGWAVVLVM